jgi:hypothetical protein
MDQIDLFDVLDEIDAETEQAARSLALDLPARPGVIR